MNETVDAEEKEINQLNQGAETAALSTAVRKKRAWRMESLDNKVNKIGIKYRRTTATPELSLNGHVSALDHWLIKQILHMIGHPQFTLVVWDGQTVYGDDKDNIPKVILCDRGALLRLIVDPELHFGDLYSNGRIRFEGDLSGFLVDVFGTMPDYGTGNKLRRFFTGLLHHTLGNTLDRARNNIHHHYDLSNEFYQNGWTPRPCSIPVRIFQTRI